MIKVKAPAKINLTLEIVKKLTNGYHQLRSVMLKLDNLYDEIEINFYPQKKDCEIICSSPEVPTNEKNICFQIAQEFFQKTKKSVGLKIKIKKRIPVATGLGGGSSDGATVLLALNKYFQNYLNQKELINLASRVGKDIPFFLQKEKMAYVTGMGEKLKGIEKFPKLNMLIINLKGKISTQWAYQELDKKLKFMEDKRRINLSQKLIKAIQRRESIQGLFYNDFDLIAEEKYPQIKEIKNKLIAMGALGAFLTGKGPVVVGIFKKKKEAMQMKKYLYQHSPRMDIQVG